MKKTIVIAASLVLLIAAACKKKSKNGDDGPSAAQQIANVWLYDTAGFDTDKNGTIDQPLGALEQDCDLDNSFTFKSDGTGVFDDGAVKCDPADPQTTAFTWALSNHDSTLVIGGDIMEELKGDAQILLLNDTIFQFSKQINLTSLPVPFSANLVVSLTRK